MKVVKPIFCSPRHMITQTKRYLFICSANKNRSKTAKHICEQLSHAKGKAVRCESAGIHPLAVRRVTKQTADRADRIFVMEDDMKTMLEDDFRQPKGKIICLDIPDVYPLQDPELEAILRQKLEPYI